LFKHWLERRPGREVENLEEGVGMAAAAVVVVEAATNANETI